METEAQANEESTKVRRGSAQQSLSAQSSNNDHSSPVRTGDDRNGTEHGNVYISGQVNVAPTDDSTVSLSDTSVTASLPATMTTEATKFVSELRELLATLYSDPQSMERVAVDAGLDPRRIYFAASAINVWCDIINEANKQQKVNRLLEVARNEYRVRIDGLTQRYQNYPMFGLDGTMFAPPQERRTTVEIRVNGNYSTLSSEDRSRFLRAIDEFLSIRGIEGVNIVRVQDGSMIVTLELPHSELVDLHQAVTGTNTLGGHTVVDITMHNADLSMGNLRGADLHGSAMNNANLYQANLMNANLMGADLSGANLSKANLSEANLSRAILTGAELDQTILWDVSLYNADLRGADLSRAVLSDGTIRKMAHTRYDKFTVWPEGFNPKSANLKYS